ncbi:MAG TPA: hypothetical protein VMV81_04390 [Phycisphaerae bacterium]|nr:hypothetical protein [Phycisphaerae bacterium]
MSSGTWNDDEIKAHWECSTIQPKCLANKTFDSISLGGVPKLPADGDSDTSDQKTIGYRVDDQPRV